MSKGCLKCGTQNADAATLCRGCGAGLGTEPSQPALARANSGPVCRMCGHVNRSATRFCSKCGTDQTLVTDPDPATEPVDYSILATLPPRLSAPAASREPPHPAAGLFGAEPARKPLGLWAGLAALVVALAAGAWWTRSSHGTAAAPAPTPAAPAASAAPPPVTPAVVAPVVEGASAPLPASAPAAEPAPMPASAPDPVASAVPAPPTSAAAPIAAPPAETATAPAVDPDKTVRDAKAKALRERRAQTASQAAAARAAEQDAARRRADEARARAVAPVVAPTPPVVVVAPAASAMPRSAQETCAGGNLIVRTLCESRACSRREHADEPLCQRLRAAEEKRRQQD